MTSDVPFAERGGRLRGLLDLLTGCYPSFLFGGSLGDQVPVFHLHDVTSEWLEPRLQYLVDNGYHTISSDHIARLVLDGVHPGPRALALTFDDAWESVWSVAWPLLERHGLQAILFAIPARLGTEPGDSPFVTWRQLRELHSSGVFDVQSHTRSHTMMFCGADLVDFVTPDYAREPFLNRPVTATGGPVVPIDPDALGTPLFPRRSRMSDARRFFPDQTPAERCREYVVAHGGAGFFDDPRWRTALEPIAADCSGRFEDDDERLSALRNELAEGREMLNEGLRTTTVRHVALPWGVSGTLTRRALADTGHQIAFAERPFRLRAVRAGDDSLQLMRLSGKFLTCLPGRARHAFFPIARER
jgi:hypothetical protein